LDVHYYMATPVFSIFSLKIKYIKMSGIPLALVSVKVVLIFSRGGGHVPEFAGRGELGFC
jgi:hypothetical protein